MEFQALTDAQGDEDEKANRRVGRIMAILANLNRGRGQPSKSEEDFIPKRPKRDTMRAQSKEQLQNQIQDLFGAFNSAADVRSEE